MQQQSDAKTHDVAIIHISDNAMAGYEKCLVLHLQTYDVSSKTLMCHIVRIRTEAESNTLLVNA